MTPDSLTVVHASPYPGLRAFRQDEAALFFGRDDCVDDMVDKLAQTRFLAVLGASGSGKSSLVRTGLLGGLQLGLDPHGGTDWAVAEMHPGADPLREMAHGLLAAFDRSCGEDDVEALAEMLRRSPRALIRWCQAGNLPQGRNLLILADQFEELFRYGDYARRENADSFVRLLLESSRSAEVPIRVVLTMRSEFLAVCTLFDGLAERINEGLYLTPRMRRDACRLAIEGPAMVCGLTVAPALVNRLLNDITLFAPFDDAGQGDAMERLAHRADQLPLMQHVLNLLWTRAQQRGGPVVLDEADYVAVGGLGGALDAHGAQIIAALGDDSDGGPIEPLVARIFRTLVTGNAVATAVRRPTSLGDLAALAGRPLADIARVVDAFRAPANNFMQPPPAVPLHAGTIVDISHESLIRQWSLLNQWTLHEARSVDFWNRLCAGADRYERREGDLLHGLDLDTFRLWWQEEQPGPAWQARYGGDFVKARDYFEKSRALADARLAEAEAAQTREKDGLRRHARRTGALALATTILAAGFGYQGWRAHSESLALQKELKAEEAATRREHEAKNRADLYHHINDMAQQQTARLNLEMAQKTNNLKLEQLQHQLSENRRRAAEAGKMQDEAVIGQYANQAAPEVTDKIMRDHPDVKKLIDKNPKFAGLSKLTSSATGGTPNSDENARGASGLGGSKVDTAAPFGADANSGSSQGATQPVVAAAPAAQDKALSADELAKFADDVGQQPDPRAVAVMQQPLIQAKADYAAAQTASPQAQLAASTRYATLLLAAGEAGDSGPAGNGGGAAGAVIADVERIGAAAGSAPRGVAATTAYLRMTLATMRRDNALIDQWFDRMAPATKDGAALSAPELLGRALIAIQNGIDAVSGSDDEAKAIEQASGFTQRGLELAPGDSVFLREEARVEWLRASRAYVADHAAGLAIMQKLETRLIGLTASAPGDQTLLATLAQMQAAQIDFVDNEADKQRARLRAIATLDSAFRDKPMNLLVPGLAKHVYEQIVVTEFASSADRAQYYRPIAQAFSALGNAFPRSEFGWILADARRQVGRGLFDDSRVPDAALAYLSASVDAYDRNATLMLLAGHYAETPPPAFADDPSDICEAQRDVIKLLSKRGDIGKAQASLADLTRACRPALQQFPYDYYLRMSEIYAHLDLARAMYNARDYKSAVEHLEFASHWGENEASTMLADIYGKGYIGPVDPARAKTYSERAKLQGLKQFTVQATNKAGTEQSFTVSVREWPAEYYEPKPAGLGFAGIDDEVQWAAAARKLTIPEAVAEAMRKLQKLAIENAVSFPELASYALEASHNAETGTEAANVARIADTMRKANFRPNPAWNLDPAGIALHGYDPVSYTQGDKAAAGRADTFALWNGALWLFANASNKAAFNARPEHYAPQYGGFAATQMAEYKNDEDPSPTLFRIVDGKLYLFTSQSDRDAWTADAQHVGAGDMYWDFDVPAPHQAATPLGEAILKRYPVKRLSEYESAQFRLAQHQKEVAHWDTPNPNATRLANALGGRAWTYLLTRQPAKAQADAERALQLDPDQHWIAASLGEAMLMLGQVDKGMAILRSEASEKGINKKSLICEDTQADMTTFANHQLLPAPIIARVRAEITCKTEQPSTTP